MKKQLSHVLIALLACIQLSKPLRAAPTPQNDSGAILVAISAAAKRNDCVEALKLVKNLSGASGYSALPDRARLYASVIGYRCAWQQKEHEVAIRFVYEATGVRGSPPETWADRFALDQQNNRLDDAVSTIETIGRNTPEILNGMQVRYIFFLIRSLKDNPVLRQRALKVLSSPTFQPVEVGASADYFRGEYAILLAKSGDMSGASAMVSSIDTPSTLKRVSLDLLLRSTLPTDFSMRAAVERHMARMRELAAAHATAIRPQQIVADDLLMLDRGEEALATLDAIHPDKAPAEYLDNADQLNWWWNSKSRAYALLGRYDDAVSALTQGKSIKEGGQPNISQTINLSELQLHFGHSEDALATLAPVAEGRVPGSPYGFMQFRKNHGCASFRTGKLDDAQADLKFLKDHSADAPVAQTELQVCMRDIEGAATTVIKQLDTPDQRIDALIYLSDFVVRPPTYPSDPDAEALRSLKARPDVLAAISRAGGIRKFDISE